jgi:hypothetical protein
MPPLYTRLRFRRGLGRMKTVARKSKLKGLLGDVA